MSELDKFLGELSPAKPFEYMERHELIHICNDLQSKWLSEQKAGMELAFEYEEQSKQLADHINREVMLRDALDQLLDDMGDDGHCVCEAAKQQAIEALAATEPKP
ncbi:MAG: hypothetical protein IPG22_06280 [Acidobacteria bacterium]|nr:hypothetical protein [Acidobacteriota bacterium]